jgi:osmotically-inducible protein OsmY
MNTRNTAWQRLFTLALVLTTTLLSFGCAREREHAIDGPGADVEVERGPNGTEVEIDRESQVEQDLEQAGADLRQAGREAGRSLEEDTRDARRELRENVRQAGQSLRDGLQEAGQAIDQGAREVEREVGPVVREVAADAALTAKVKARLAADPDVAAVTIDVDTLDGQVTLSGKVASPAERAEAEKLAKGTDGVLSVVNHLQVAGQASPVPPTK